MGASQQSTGVARPLYSSRCSLRLSRNLNFLIASEQIGHLAFSHPQRVAFGSYLLPKEFRKFSDEKTASFSAQEYNGLTLFKKDGVYDKNLSMPSRNLSPRSWRCSVVVRDWMNFDLNITLNT